MMYKCLLVAFFLFFYTVTALVDGYDGYYCQVKGKSVSGWNNECKGRTAGCDVFGTNCSYCKDCDSAEKVCNDKGGQLWQASDWYSWRDRDGYKVDCSKLNRLRSDFLMGMSGGSSMQGGFIPPLDLLEAANGRAGAAGHGGAAGHT